MAKVYSQHGADIFVITDKQSKRMTNVIVSLPNVNNMAENFTSTLKGYDYKVLVDLLEEYDAQIQTVVTVGDSLVYTLLPVQKQQEQPRPTSINDYP